MTPTEPTSNGSGAVSSAGINLEDIGYTLFRHKWLILASAVLGVIGAIVMLFIRPPLYLSQAQVMLHYVQDNRTASSSGQGAEVPETSMATIMNSEVEILHSLDVAQRVATKVGPALILAKKGGGNDLMTAAYTVKGGLETDVPSRTSILGISFKHRDKTIVQPVLRAIMEAYMDKHRAVHGLDGGLDAFYSHQKDDMQKKLAGTEEALKKIKAEANVISVEDTKKKYEEQITRWQNDLWAAQQELVERKALLGDAAQALPAGGTTNTPQFSVPSEKISEYTEVCAILEQHKKQKRLLILTYKVTSPIVQIVQSQIDKYDRQKSDLENDFPALAQSPGGGPQGVTNSLASDMAIGLAGIKKLSARVEFLQSVLTNLQSGASKLMQLEPTIAQLERQREVQSTNYMFVSSKLQEGIVNQLLGPGNMLNMSSVEEPTPPSLDMKKLKKLIGMVFGACVALGIGLAFLHDFVLKRTIRRSADIERHLHLPVFITIPDTNWKRRLRLPSIVKQANEPATNGMMVWKPIEGMQTYTEGLRERLMTYFEVNNLNHKTPKLVAVTSCGNGSGVSTLASGLAASLSRTGVGNVLLVDMNGEQGVAHSFSQGRQGQSLVQMLEQPEHRAEAEVQDNLYLATIVEENNEKLAKALPSRFTHLVPKLKASDYDYIIFDMPPVTQTSPTPRLASHMDIVLLVLESEKTGQQLAARATALMRDSRATVAAVLNKYRPRVPAQLSQEL